MEGPVVKVRKLDLLKLHNLANGVAVKIRHMLSESELKEYSDSCLTQSLKGGTNQDDSSSS